MKNKKEQELLKDILAIFLKYDYVTIEHCLNYLVENKQHLSELLTFANGGEEESQNKRNRSAIDKIVLTAGNDKGVIIKQIYRYLSSKRFTYEQVYHMSARFFEKASISVNLNADNKNQLLLALARELANLPIKDIHEFDFLIQNESKVENENSLENWSKVIIKNPSE